jgi:hypothetical protein
MHLDFWQALGVVCGALITAGTLIGLTIRWVVRPVWRTIRRLNLVADDLLGDKARHMPSLAERVAANTLQTAALAVSIDRQTSRLEEVAHRLDEHLTWHSGGGRSRANGPRPLPDPARRE